MFKHASIRLHLLACGLALWGAALALPAQAGAQRRYDFTADAVGKEPSQFVPMVGNWVVTQDEGRRVLLVDGRIWRKGQPSGGLADKARAMLKRLKLEELAFHHDSQSQAYRALSIEVMPTTIVFDAQGREAGRLRQHTGSHERRGEQADLSHQPRRRLGVAVLGVLAGHAHRGVRDRREGVQPLVAGPIELVVADARRAPAGGIADAMARSAYARVAQLQQVSASSQGAAAAQQAAAVAPAPAAYAPARSRPRVRLRHRRNDRMLARTCRLAGGATAVTALLLTTTPAGAQSASAGKASAPKAWPNAALPFWRSPPAAPKSSTPRREGFEKRIR